MGDPETEQLADELRQFKEEKEKIRELAGQIGGTSSVKRERAITRFFLIVLLLLFALDICRHLAGVHVPLPPLFSLEIGVMLVSVKIIWMVHSQTRVEHFQFWILNSIEFRVNDIAKAVRQIQDRLAEQNAADDQAAQGG